MKYRGDKYMDRIVKTMPWGKWLIIFASLVLCVGMGATQAFAISSPGNNFTMINAGTDNVITGGMNNVIFTWDGTQRHSVAKSNQVSNVQFSSTCPFFGFTWSTHDNVLYGPGTYTVYTGCPAGSPGCGLVKPGFPPLTFTVGPDELGVHYQFNWNVTTDIDMVNVFTRKSAFSPSPLCTNNPDATYCSNQNSCGGSPDTPRDKVWDLASKDITGSGVSGLPFVDGPFIGFSGNMSVMVPGGIPAHLLPDHNPMTFGGFTQDKILTISNNGDPGNDLIFPSNAVYSAPSSTLFSIAADSCSGKTISPGQTCAMTVHFEFPGTRGDYIGSFQMQSNDKDTITRINFSAGNSPPDKPVLVSPGNGLTGVGTEQEFRWMISTDPEGDAVKYQVFVCTDRNFGGADCAPAYVASRTSKGVFYAGGAGLLMIGMTFFGGLKGRKRIVLLLVVAVLLSGGALMSCHSKDVSETGSTPAGQMSYIAPTLSAGTTYYWKVVADDGQSKNNLSLDNDVWSFTTK